VSRVLPALLQVVGELGEDLTLSVVRGTGMLVKATAIAAYSTRVGITKVGQGALKKYVVRPSGVWSPV